METALPPGCVNFELEGGTTAGGHNTAAVPCQLDTPSGQHLGSCTLQGSHKAPRDRILTRSPGEIVANSAHEEKRPIS